MNEQRSSQNTQSQAGNESAQEFVSFSRQILWYANRGLPRNEFLTHALKMVKSFSGCDAVELRLVEHGKLFINKLTENARPLSRVEIVRCKRDKDGNVVASIDVNSDLEKICEDIFLSSFDPALPYYSINGSFFVGDTGQTLELSSETCKWAGGRTIRIDCGFRSLAIVPLPIEDRIQGLMLLGSEQQDWFTAERQKSLESIAHILGIAFVHRRAQIGLRERVKELTCLFGIARAASRPGISLQRILQEAVQLLPPGWLYPQLAEARITLNGYSCSTPGFREDLQKLTADIVADGLKRGSVEVAYVKKMPELDEGPFLSEERHLIDAIGNEVALIVERKHAEEEREKLQEQLRHADRLATIGQLAAGVAHELNEPLGGILGFAQLAKKGLAKPEQLQQDMEKIEAASLHAREVVRKLMLFARQSLQRKSSVDVNEIIEGGLYFLESRCAKAGITLVKELAADLPEIIADESQLHQVLINLVVNAIQAMPEGGTITIRTAKHDSGVMLAVSDTGIGIEESLLGKIFLPFFTTKDVDEGTGLGLAVVHGIVASHGGSVRVESTAGQGTRFEVRLPSNNIENANADRENRDDC